MDRIQQFEDDWIKATGAGSVQASNNLYQELLAIQTADGGAASPAFKAHLKKINEDLRAKNSLTSMQIEGVADDDKRVIVSDNNGDWEVGSVDGQLTGMYRHSGPRGNIHLGDLSNYHVLQHHELYEKGMSSIKAGNVKQGQLGDCYFMATLSELAAQNPQAVARMTRLNRDGNYTVTFPGKDPVTIDKPNDFELEHLASPGDGDWANGIEKAHRKLTGKELLDPGSDPKEAMELLTGNKAESLQLDSHDLGDQLEQALKNKDLVVATTDAPPKEDANKKKDPDDKSDAFHLSSGLKAPHAYSVLAYDPAKGIVTLRDPGADNEPMNYPHMPDGLIQMTLDQFRHAFIEVDRCSSVINSGANPASAPPVGSLPDVSSAASLI